jgi:hypothetical protein
LHDTIENVRRTSYTIWDVSVHVTAIYIFLKFILSFVFNPFRKIQFQVEAIRELFEVQFTGIFPDLTFFQKLRLMTGLCPNHEYSTLLKLGIPHFEKYFDIAYILTTLANRNKKLPIDIDNQIDYDSRDFGVIATTANFSTVS